MNRRIDKIHRCYKTIREMLLDRGYIEDEDDPSTKLHIKCAEDVEFMRNTLSQLDKEPQKALLKLQMIRQHAMFDKILYIFFVNEKIGVRTIHNYVSIMGQHQPPVNHAILVSVSNEAVLTPFAVKCITELYNTEGKIIEHFYLNDLLMNITKHQLQPPKIVICTPEEKEQVLKGYKLKESQMHWILQSDPLSKYFGLQQNDVLKIIRYSETTGKTLFYRICKNEGD